MGMLELLGVFCILSISLAPLLYLVRLTKGAEERSEMEFTATLLAQHVMEKIVALSIANPSSLPPMTPEQPLVAGPDGAGAVSEYFRFLLGDYRTITQEESPKLYWALKPYSCQVDTYYLEDRLYKIIVYIGYEEDARRKRIYLERLIDVSSEPKAEALPVARPEPLVPGMTPPSPAPSPAPALPETPAPEIAASGPIPVLPPASLPVTTASTSIASEGGKQ